MTRPGLMKAMLGLLVTAVFCKGIAGLGLRILAPWLPEDKAARLGISGIIGLGLIGTITFLIGLLPGGLQWGLCFPIAASVFGVYHLWTQRADWWPIKIPSGLPTLFPVAIAAFCLLSAIGVLAPSTMVDWDTPAYHLAVPKVWLAAGQVQFISYDHHSNFPMAVDALFALGLTWGGAAGAKAFCWMFLLLGLLAIFGTVRSRVSESAAWWAALAFASMPVVCWESGTAYIDIVHGLFAGFGIWFGARHVVERDRNSLVLTALCLALAAGSKYTGFLTFGIVYGFIAISYVFQKSTKSPEWRPAFLCVLMSIAIASPCYVRNVVNTGNPVYPFAYSIFKGKNWDAFSDKIYREEQATFGVGRDVPGTGESILDKKFQPSRLGASIFGLAYQPGRFTNPMPLAGQGLAAQAMGVVPIVGMVLLLASGLRRPETKFGVGMVLMMLFAWAFLSQQSRYITTVAVPLLLFSGDLAARLRSAFQIIVAMQALVTGYVIETTITSPQLQFLSGKNERPPLPFSEPAEFLNSEVKSGRVALFDEVFGFLLDVPYFWANPGHSTEIGYDNLKDGQDLAASLKRLGCTYAYLNLSMEPDAQKMVDAMQNPSLKYESDLTDIRNKWRVLFVQAVQTQALTPIKAFGSRRIVFKIN